MNKMQKSPESTPRPWLTQSSWSMAPFLFLFEIIIIWGASFFLVSLGILQNPIFIIPMIMGFVSYHIGKRCALDALNTIQEKVSRKRLWGASLLIGAIYAVCTFLLFRAFLPEVLEKTWEENPEFLEELYKQNPEYASIPVEELFSDGAILLSSILFSTFLVFFHMLFLWLGASRTEKHLLS